MKITFTSFIHSFAVLLLLLLLAHGELAAQDDPARPADTTLLPALLPDSSRADSVALTANRSGIDTVVDYSARDSTVFDVQGRVMRLYGDAMVVTGAQKLTAAYIEIDFTNSTLYAEARYDSAARRYYGVPVFRDASEELSANTLSYNFRTKRGTLGAAETRFDQGFYYGEKIKRVSENILFVQDGRYTTCDAPHPHYFFSSPRMEVIVGDKVLADQVALNVADVPIFYIPLGIYFASSGGKQSGLIIPQWSQNAQRGFTLEGLGYFWDGGPWKDYFDNKLTADLYSKGGFSLRNQSRFAIRGVIDVSNLDLTLGRTRNDPDEEMTTSYIANYDHRMRLGRKTELGGSLRFASQNAIRQNNTRAGEFTPELQDITTQRVQSDLSLSHSWNWGSFSTSFQRAQNIITDELEVTVPARLSLPTINPFAGTDGILESFSLGYNANGSVQWVRQDTLPGGGFRVQDRRFAINHNPSVSISPKFDDFTFQPSFSYAESWFFRRAVKQTIEDTVVTSYLPGFYRGYSWNAGLNVSTRLYGLVQPRIFGINAIRHTITPTIGLRYSPDFGSDSYGFYDQVFNPRTNQIERYSIFEGDAGIGSIPSAGLQQVITLNLRNEFEAKIAQGDTVEDRKVRLLSLGLSTSYNAAAYNNFRWSPINMDLSTELGPIGYVSGNATFSLYDQDTLGNAIPQLLIREGKGLFRVQSAGISFQTSFSDQGFTTGTSTAAVADSAAARRERFNFEQIPFNQAEFFGERVQGLGEFRIPWQISFTGSYNVARVRRDELQTNVNLSTTFSFSLTPTTTISSSGSYDFKLGKFLIPSISLFKDLHCWEMAFDWRPSGYGRGFYFRIGLKADQLKDLKLEQSETFYE